MRGYSRIFVLVCSMLLWVLPAVSSAAVTPDASFAGDGRLQIYPSGLAGYDEIFPRDTVSDVTLDQQGRIVVVGTAGGRLPIEHSDALVARFNPDGSLDTSFSGDGILHFEWEPENSYATAVAVDHQGRIVVAGGTSGSSLFSAPAVARFLPDGAPDPSFGEDGLATVAIEGDAGGVAIDAQDRILVAARASGSDYFVTIRLTEHGILDDSFGGDGLVLTSFPGADYSISVALAVDASGRVVVAGNLDLLTGTSLAVVRYTESGSLDSNFDGDGRVVLDFGTLNWEHATDVVLDGEGRVVIVGDGGPDALVGRLLPDGKPDPSFSGDGRVITSRADWLYADSTAIDSAGRIVVAGTVANEQIPSWSGWPYLIEAAFLLRYGPDGTLEEDLGPEGYVREDFLAPYVKNASLAIDQQGRYLLAGSLFTEGYGSGLGFVGLARFLVDYPPPVPPQWQQAPPPAPPLCGGKKATIIGTEAPDVLRGTSKGDVIVGLGGGDVLRGLGGDDLVCAGAGNDIVRAGAGNDVVEGEAGKDRLFGEGGEDRLIGGAGVDRSACGPGRDVALVDRLDRVNGCERAIHRKPAASRPSTAVPASGAREP